jgi:hypothetical protein
MLKYIYAAAEASKVKMCIVDGGIDGAMDVVPISTKHLARYILYKIIVQ